MAIQDTDKFLVHRNETSYWMSALDFKNSFDFAHSHKPEYLLKGSYLTRGTGTYLTLNRSTTPTNTRKGTLSYWVKPTKVVTGRDYHVTSGLGSTSNTFMQVYINSESFRVGQYSHTPFINDSRKIRDLAGWYHVVVSWDGDASGTNNIMRFYVNGELQTNTSTAPNVDFALTKPNQNLYIGQESTSWPSESYFSEIHIIDGQALTCDSFGYREEHGFWYPKQYVGEYGNNGFYLDFDGDFNDKSGNNHHFTPTGNIASDLSKDCPTDNFATLNPLLDTSTYGANTFSEGNLKTTATSTTSYSNATISVTSGKWYCEFKPISGWTSHQNNYITATNLHYASNGDIRDDVSWTVGAGATYTDGDIIGLALNMDVSPNTVEFFKNGVSQGTYTQNASSTITERFFRVRQITSGQSTMVNFGQQPFAHTPPDGFKALSTLNLTEPNLTPSENFKAVTYTGNQATQTIELGFKPDLVWTKTRNGPYSNTLIDSVRGTNKILFANNADADTTESNNITGWTESGYTLGNSANVNGGYNYVAWCWKAGDSAVTNNDGTIESTVNANPDNGFSVVTYTGIGQLGATVGHGLGKKPSIHIYKNRDSASDWSVSYELTGGFKQMHLNSNAAEMNLSWAAPTDKVFTVGGGDGSGGANKKYVAYCFAEVEGFSKFGTYTGNNSTDGTFVYTGFRPALIIVKRTDLASSWQLWDTARDTYNVTKHGLRADLSNEEYIGSANLDILSNGFKLKHSAGLNELNGTFLYMAFAEKPINYTKAR